ncbi:Serine/threonine-protein kinase MHK [Zea mays]|nr:Serine/threonine-protein kinase MHK [Zea mays]
MQTKGSQLSEVMTTASSEAIDLISSLCSWDPSKRPKATEVLQHTFFQGCTCVPLPVRRKASSLPKTPPCVGSKRISENSVARRFSTGTLSTMKSHSNAPAKSNGLSRTGNPVLRHSRSLPETGRRAVQKVSSITEKLSQMSVTSRTRSAVKPAAPTMKAGHGKSDFLGKSDDIPPAKRLTRKLVS